MRTATPDNDRDAWARLRFAVIGSLLASPPEGRKLKLALRELSRREWTHPGRGTPIRFGVSTIEHWYYLARNATDPVAALRRRVRTDKGQTRVLPPSITTLIRSQHREHPDWTAQLHYDNVAVLVAADTTCGSMPSYSTLRRYLRQQGLDRRTLPKRDSAGAQAARERHVRLETRSYEVSHVNALFHLDFHHGTIRVLEPNGSWIKPMLLCVLDDHSRLVCHLQWYRNETVESLVHGFCQALAKRGLPRALMTDNGSAMTSAEFTAGLEALGIQHDRTLVYSPAQNGKQESFWGNVEGRFIAMLDTSEPITLDELNRITQIWVERDYQKRVHSEIAITPLSRFLDAPSVGRAAPDTSALRRAFRQRGVRRQRRSDGTLSLAGRRFEVPGRYGHLARLHVAWARWNLAEVDLLDPDTGEVIAPVHPLDRQANASGQRRARAPQAADAEQRGSTGTHGYDTGATGHAPLLAKFIEDFVATGVPPGFLPSPGAPEPKEDR